MQKRRVSSHLFAVRLLMVHGVFQAGIVVAAAAVGAHSQRHILGLSRVSVHL